MSRITCPILLQTMGRSEESKTREAARRPDLRRVSQTHSVADSRAGKLRCLRPRSYEFVSQGLSRKFACAGYSLGGIKNKSSEVVLGPFVSASSSLLDPCSTCYAASLAGCCVRSSLGLRAHRQPEKPTQRLGTLSCLRRFFLLDR